MVAVVVASVAQPAAAEVTDSTQAYIAQWLSQPTLTFSDTTIETSPLRPAYQTVNYQLKWVDASGLTPRANKALEVIAAADAHGINPEVYNVHAIRTIAAMVPDSDDQRMQRRLSLELLMSTAVMRYATDMQSGVVHPQWDTGSESLTTDMQAQFINDAANAPDAAAYLTALAPTSAQYVTLMKSYAQYQTIAGKGGWPVFVNGKTIKPGMQDARVATLRQILTITGDLAANTNASMDYDAATVQGVKAFQSRHGIQADGVVGASTQAALGVSAEKRVQQIAMTMERMRWMPRDIGSRYVLVNLPNYQLTAVSGKDQLQMNVIVGKTATPTPMFTKEITDITFNPSWGVPTKIAATEMLPKIRKNPNYLTNAGFTLVSNGETVDPNSVDWSNVSQNHFNYSIRQNPGDGNALGKVKFTIPDSDNIYLHDTSNRSMFERADRDLSHGCVRLGEPKALTQFVLSHEGWSEAKIDAAYDGDTSRTVKITPMPVHLVYWTSWVDTQGRTHFAQDIYGKDKSLLAQMSSPLKRSGENVKLAMN